MRSVVIGNGISGLLSALTLQGSGHDVVLISRSELSFEDTPLILPQIVIDFLERVIPGIVRELKSEHGALMSDHSGLLRLRFPDNVTVTSTDSFLFINRKALHDYLLEVVRTNGIVFLESEVKKFHCGSGIITGLETTTGIVSGEVFFDCTGSSIARKNWLEKSGFVPDNITYYDEEFIFYRPFHSEQIPALNLKSTPGCRGGIYPVAKDRFFLSLTIPSAISPHEKEIPCLAEKFLAELNETDLMSKARPQGDWKKTLTTDRKSDFYISSRKDLPENFFPLGDGVLVSNPVYGRGLAQLVLQLRYLGNASDHVSMRTAVLKGQAEAFIKWKEVVSAYPAFPSASLKKPVLRLLEKSAEAYSHYLDFYQLRITPAALILKLAGVYLKRILKEV